MYSNRRESRDISQSRAGAVECRLGTVRSEHLGFRSRCRGGGEQQKNLDRSPAGNKQTNCAFNSGGHIKGKWVSKGICRRDEHVTGRGAGGRGPGEYTAQGENLGGQRPSTAALTVGAAKARTHSGKQGFHLVVLKEGCLWATPGRREIRFHCLCDI